VQRASGVPHALFGRKVLQSSGEMRREIAKACFVNMLLFEN
jgi:hypothetical protein